LSAISPGGGTASRSRSPADVAAGWDGNRRGVGVGRWAEVVSVEVDGAASQADQMTERGGAAARDARREEEEGRHRGQARQRPMATTHAHEVEAADAVAEAAPGSQSLNIVVPAGEGRWGWTAGCGPAYSSEVEAPVVKGSRFVSTGGRRFAPTCRGGTPRRMLRRRPDMPAPSCLSPPVAQTRATRPSPAAPGPRGYLHRRRSGRPPKTSTTGRVQGQRIAGTGP